MTGVNLAESFAPCTVHRHDGDGSELRFDVYESEPGGAFAFYGVPDGEYDLTAERLESDRSDRLGSEPRRVTVRGADVTGVELRLSPRAAIQGKVVLDPLPAALRREASACSEE